MSIVLIYCIALCYLNMKMNRNAVFLYLLVNFLLSRQLTTTKMQPPTTIALLNLSITPYREWFDYTLNFLSNIDPILALLLLLPISYLIDDIKKQIDT